MPDTQRSRALGPPLVMTRTDGHVGAAVRGWATTSMRPAAMDASTLPTGTTLLLRTGGHWYCLVAIAGYDGHLLHPALVFKNPVPLWQSASTPLDGPITRAAWPRLRRLILVHNPGLDGTLCMLDDMVTGETP